MAKRRLQTSVKQILTRDFNWRMGHLRRVLTNIETLDDDLAATARTVVHEQMEREQETLQRRIAEYQAVQNDFEKLLELLKVCDWTLAGAIYEATRNKEAIDAQKKAT